MADVERNAASRAEDAAAGSQHSLPWENVPQTKGLYARTFESEFVSNFRNSWARRFVGRSPGGYVAPVTWSRTVPPVPSAFVARSCKSFSTLACSPMLILPGEGSRVTEQV